MGSNEDVLGKAGPSGNGEAVCDGEISCLRAGVERMRRRKGSADLPRAERTMRLLQT